MSQRPQLVISADDHVVEPPQLWQDRLPSKYLEIGPRVERRRFDAMGLRNGAFRADFNPEGALEGDVWLFEGREYALPRNIASAGGDPADDGFDPVTFEQMRPGCYDPAARLEDMDLDGIDASLCFPNTFPRFCGQTFSLAKDRDLALACIEAYNDWMVDEWSGPSSGRLIPNCLVPLWDPELAAAEVRRNAARGVRVMTFSELPANIGLPSIHSGHWAPLFDACDETGTIVSMHIGSGSKLLTTSDDAPPGIVNALTFTSACLSMADWLLSGLFVRHPNLKVLFAECQIGWVPYLLGRVDHTWEHTSSWNEIDLPEPPSSYFRDHVFCTFFDDDFGLMSLDAIGDGNVLFETDYPHTDTTFPHTRKAVEHVATLVPQERLDRILGTNAVDLFSLDLEPRTPSSA
jgi:predicted TIM-barrel fold metal-dependent hydrolase